MISTEEILGRADLQKLVSFLLYGAELNTVDPRTLEERINSAKRSAHAWLDKKFPSFQEQEEVSREIMSPWGDSNECYMALGVKAGFLLAAQVYNMSSMPSSAKETRSPST